MDFASTQSVVKLQAVCAIDKTRTCPPTADQPAIKPSPFVFPSSYNNCEHSVRALKVGNAYTKICFSDNDEPSIIQRLDDGGVFFSSALRKRE